MGARESAVSRQPSAVSRQPSAVSSSGVGELEEHRISVVRRGNIAYRSGQADFWFL